MKIGDGDPEELEEGEKLGLGLEAGGGRHAETVGRRQARAIAACPPVDCFLGLSRIGTPLRLLDSFVVLCGGRDELELADAVEGDSELKGMLLRAGRVAAQSAAVIGKMPTAWGLDLRWAAEGAGGVEPGSDDDEYIARLVGVGNTLQRC